MKQKLSAALEKVQRRRKFRETALKHFLPSLAPQQLVIFLFLVHSEFIYLGNNFSSIIGIQFASWCTVFLVAFA